MKKSQKTLLKYLLLITLVCLLAMSFLGDHKEDKKCFSPSGEYFFKTSINRDKADVREYLCVVVTIYNNIGEIVETIQTNASNTMRWDVSWGENDSILLNSSDIGNYKWENISSERWELRYINPDELLIIKLNMDPDFNLVAESLGGLIYTVYEPSDATIEKVSGKDFYCYDLSTLATNFEQDALKLYLHKDENNGNITIKFDGFRDFFLTWNPLKKYKPLRNEMFDEKLVLVDSAVNEIVLSLVEPD